jgi:hypothetical protein
MNTNVASNLGFSLRPIYKNILNDKIISFWPNPVMNNKINLKIDSSTKCDFIFLKLYNVEGKLVWSNSINGIGNLEFNDITFNNLSSGFYNIIIDVYHDNNLVTTVKDKLIIK